MNFFLELYRHGRLAEKRHPMYEKSRFSKFWIYFMALFGVGYLIFLGTMFGLMPTEDMSTEPYHIANGVLIFFLTLDFIMRFSFQKIPAQEMKPYLLLPVKRNRLIDFLLIRSGLNGFNLIWLFFFIPFSILTVAKFYGVWGICTYCLGIWLLMVFNNYWFLLCRTLMGERLWWALLPLGVYGILAAGLLIPDNSPLFDWSATLGESFIEGSFPAFLSLLAAIMGMWLTDRVVIRHFLYNELNKVEDSTVKIKTVSEYKFLDRFGEIGEYMRLELKMMLRNKMCRKSLYTVILAEVLISVLLCFHTKEHSMSDFFILYNYALLGILFLSTLMGYEGNYIDGLMSRKESIYSLLRAKYLLYSTLQILPTLLLLPAVIMGSIPLMDCIAWMFFVPGAVYFIMFQMAVYNNKTTDLNTKISSRQNMGTGMQNLISAAAFLLPLALDAILRVSFGKTATDWILTASGIAFIATSPLWLKNVYSRFMKRRYINMEGFRNSRQK